MSLWVVSKTRFDVVRVKLMLENAISRKIIDSALHVEEDGRTRLEHVIDAYVQKTHTPAWEKLRNYPLFKVIDIIKRAFNADDERMKRELQNPTIRKILLVSLKSLRKYGLQTPQNFVAPIMVVWNFTYRCNLRCKHCYEDAGVLRSGPTNELTTDEKYHVLEELDKNHVPTIFFSGGEPLMAADFWELAEAAKKRGFYLSIASNGTLFANKENAARAKEIGFGYIAVSLDAADPKKHDEFRGVPGMWERAVQGIKNLNDVGITTVIQFTLTKYNKDELPKMFKLQKEIGAYKVIVYNYIPVGRGDMDMDITPEEREEAFRVMYEELEAGYHTVATTAPQLARYCKMMGSDTIIFSHYGDAKAKELGVIADIVGGCGAGRAYCSVQPDGRVTPCVYMPYITVGNLREQTFEEIWNSPFMEYLRDRSDLWGHCAECPYQAVCGGCRARAYVYFDDFKGPDPGCIFNREYYYNREKYRRMGKAAEALNLIHKAPVTVK